MLVSLLQRGAEQRLPGAGDRELVALVDASFETPVRRRRLRREVAVLFRSLRRAGVVKLERGRAAGRDGPARAAVARVDEALQRDFGLHHTLSLYLVDAVAALDPGSPDYAVDVISIAEAILEHPRALLEAQVRARKDEAIARWKAEGVPYEERIARLEEVTWDKPIAPFLYSTFELFQERHPWADRDAVRPKSIARELWEGFLSFDDYVRRYGIARLEGVLLRYLSQVHSTLARNLPEAARNGEVVEVIAYLRALLARVDSSLVEEWESLVDPARGEALAAGSAAAAGAPAEPGAERPDRGPRRLDRKLFEARVRAEMHQLLRALERRDFEGAAACVAHPAWAADEVEPALAPLFAEGRVPRADPPARLAHWTRIEERRGDGDGLRFDVVQTLLDADGEGDAQLEAEVVLDSTRLPAGPMLRILGVRS